MSKDFTADLSAARADARLSASIPFVAVAAVDVGSPKKIGLAIRHRGKPEFSGGVDTLDEFVGQIGEALSIGPVALGFECPCFLPLREDAMSITKQRCGEKGKPWSAGAGATTAALAAPVAGHVLWKIRSAAPNARPTFDFAKRLKEWGRMDLLLFEGFVSGGAKGDSDKEDAQITVAEFEKRAGVWPPESDISENRVINLLASALIAAGWDIDKSMVASPCFVVKPSSGSPP